MHRKKVRILISNDDGIDAPGIYALASAIKKIGEVFVTAPDKQQSAVGHAITMNYPLRANKFYKNGKFFGYAVDGTPADAVKLAVNSLMKQPPDIIISGINHGANTAISIIYSGTVSAATEGTILGIPSIAVSLATYGKPDFRYAANIAVKIAAAVLKNGLPKGTLLNVNVPAVNEKYIRGIKVTRQSNAVWEDWFETRRDPNNKEYYWLTGRLIASDKSEDTDQYAVENNYVSITPIQYELTDSKTLKKIKKWKW